MPLHVSFSQPADGLMTNPKQPSDIGMAFASVSSPLGFFDLERAFVRPRQSILPSRPHFRTTTTVTSRAVNASLHGKGRRVFPDGLAMLGEGKSWNAKQDLTGCSRSTIAKIAQRSKVLA